MGLISAKLWELGSIGIEETPDGICAYFEETADLEAIQQMFPAAPLQPNLPPVSFQEVSDREPVYVGTRFVIVPVAQGETQELLTPNLVVLPIDEAMAFGSGRHESTQLCLQALEQLIRPGHTVFDVGCGSGVLALAAQKLGASHVIGADIDEPAINVARRHFGGPLFVGSADCFASQTADLVVSNITGAVNDSIAAELKRILKPSGSLILAGFTALTAPQRFTPSRILADGDWQCWVCTASSISAEQCGSSATVHPARWWV